MTIQVNNHFKIKTPSELSFAVIFFIFFLFISIFLTIKDNSINYFFLIVSFIFLFLGVFFPKFLKLPNKLWFRLGILLGYIISPIIMFLIFYLLITPIGIFMTKILNKDILNQKIINKKTTYWIQRKDKVNPMHQQY